MNVGGGKLDCDRWGNLGVGALLDVFGNPMTCEGHVPPLCLPFR